VIFCCKYVSLGGPLGPVYQNSQILFKKITNIKRFHVNTFLPSSQPSLPLPKLPLLRCCRAATALPPRCHRPATALPLPCCCAAAVLPLRCCRATPALTPCCCCAAVATCVLLPQLTPRCHCQAATVTCHSQVAANTLPPLFPPCCCHC
jgi:hypothetical protein